MKNIGVLAKSELSFFSNAILRAPKGLKFKLYSNRMDVFGSNGEVIVKYTYISNIQKFYGVEWSHFVFFNDWNENKSYDSEFITELSRQESMVLK